MYVVTQILKFSLNGISMIMFTKTLEYFLLGSDTSFDKSIK